jgi:hypothetical protein
MDIKKYLGERHYADIEAKGFWDSVNSSSDVWCLCSVTEDDTVLLFHDYPEFDGVAVYDKEDDKTYVIPKRVGSLIDGVRYWYSIGRSGGKLSVHNAMTYDKPIIEKIWDKCVIPDDVWEDTFVQSKVQWFDRPCPKGAKSAHGLKGYGIKFGINKPEITDFSTMDAYKLHRVVEDCRIQKMTAKFLDAEAKLLKEKYNIDFTSAINDVEKPYASFCWTQEKFGAMVDIDHINKSINFLDGEIKRLTDHIEPNLPMHYKKKTCRVGRKEITEILLGRVVEDEYEGGEVVKRYYKPHVNFYNKDDKQFYQGFNISYGNSPKFEKLKEFRGWVKENHPETKFKVWDYEKILEEGQVLDGYTCAHFDVNPNDTDVIVGAHTRITWHQSKLTQHEIVKGYLIKHGIKWAEEWNFKKEGKQLVRAEKDMIVYYPPDTPKEFCMVYEVNKGEPIVTSPKFGEKEYAQLHGGATMGQDIALYNTYMHRRRFLSNPKDPEEKGLLAYVRPDGRVPCGLGNFQTSTGRSNQRVIVNLPSEKSVFGREMRQCIIAPDGKVLVGADQKSSQLSIAAFIANNTSYYNAVASGQKDIELEDGTKFYKFESAHCVNMKNFGLASEEEIQRAIETQDHTLIEDLCMRRDKYAKGAAFGVIFGCSGKKLGLMLDVDSEEGNRKKKRYLSEMGLDSVIDYVKRCEQQFKYGGGFYIPIFKGYWLWCRSPHVGVNYFCQGIEAIIQKIATLSFCKQIEDKGWQDHTWVIFTAHDENLIETFPEYANEVAKIMCDSYTEAGKDLLEWYINNQWAFPSEGVPSVCPDFSGGSTIGTDYSQVH